MVVTFTSINESILIHKHQERVYILYISFTIKCKPNRENFPKEIHQPIDLGYEYSLDNHLHLEHTTELSILHNYNQQQLLKLIDEQNKLTIATSIKTN